MDEELLAKTTAGLAFAAAAHAMEMALSVQQISMHVLLSKLINAGLLTHNHVAEINAEVAAIVGMPYPDGVIDSLAEPVFDVLSRHAALLKDHAARFALAGAPVGGTQ